MTWFRRRWRRILASGLLLMVAAMTGAMVWASWEIASPARAGLKDYQREFLANQKEHGFQVASFTASDGTPCIVCTPDPDGSLGDRGVIIRRQFAERGLVLNPAGEILGNLVLCHGRKGRKEDYLPIAERLCAVGFRCVIPDLPAHGDNPEPVATYGVREAGLPARVLAEAARKFGFEMKPAGLMGMSMGGSVAVHAADFPDAPWRALVVIASFDSFPAALERQSVMHAGPMLGPFCAGTSDVIYRLRSGVSLSEIQPAKHASRLRIPTMVAHGSRDHAVPTDSGRRLFEALPDDIVKKWVEIPDADHDNVFVTSYPIYADIAEWMLRHAVGDLGVR